MRRFDGKVAIVTASTAGIGLGIVRRLAQEGCNVVVSSRRQDNVELALEMLRSEDLPGRVEGIACHVGDRKQLKNLVDFTIRKFGKLDVLVSNAAVNPEAGQILDISETALDKLLQINIKSAIVLCQEAIPKMVAGGSVIFVSSYTAFQPSPPIAAYAVTKTALLGLTKALADELGHQNIRVNCIAPGIVPTKFASALVASPEAEKLNKEKTLLGRLGKAEDMASTVAFLASSDASYITGETIVVAGGMQSRL